MTGLVIASGPRDPRLYNIDADFRQALIDLSGLMVASASRRARFFHGTSVAAGGTLRVVDAPESPAHRFFLPGREFPVLGRYSNSQGTDDVSPTVRGLTLRLLDPDGEQGLLDLTFNTGELFFADTAENFRRAFAGQTERQQVLTAKPEMRSVIWSNIRTATTYPGYDFHSQVPQGFVAEDGRTWLARYRVFPVREPLLRGDIDHGGQWWPPDAPNELDRPDGDTRAPTVLRDDLRDRIASGGVTSVLQLQLRPVNGPADVERAANASTPWPAELYPWTDLAELRLDTLLADQDVEPIAFDPGLAPPDLGILLSRSPHSTTSLNHLRALLYQLSSLGRLGKELPEQLSELLRPGRLVVADRQRTVCVLGAGAAGLTFARELEKGGHRAIVLESAPEVAGKCASVTLDDREYDLGGHICTSQYRRVARLATELGVATEPTTPYRRFDLAGARIAPPDTSFLRDGGITRYQRLRAARFPRIGEPGLAHSATALAMPLSEWLADNGLQSMAATFGAGFTAAGYGYLGEDPPALYFVKYAELTGLLSDDPPLLGHPGAFTITGGFASLWRAVARQLADVRCGVSVLAIDRQDAGVVVHTDTGPIEADDLVLTVPLDQALPLLDATSAERDLAGRVRYRSYWTTLVTATGLPRSGFHLVDEHTESATSRGHCVAFHHRYPDRDVHTCYSYGRGVTELLAEDIDRAGGQLHQVHLQRQWSFLPHFESASALDELERLQGERHTYHTGSLPAFELVECTVGHAQELARRFFAPPSGPTANLPAERPTAAVRTSTEVRQWLITNIATELGVPDTAIDPEWPFDKFALESLSVATLQSGLSDYVGARVPHSLFLQLPTINAAAEYLAGARQAAPTATDTPQLLPLTPARPFFCVGGMGGSATYLRPLATALGPAQPFYALDLPGQGGVGEPLEDVRQIAEVLVAQVRQVQPTGPYRLGGHSFGGLVAYEMACLLRADGAGVAPLVLLDCVLPVPGQRPPAEDESQALTELLTLRHMFCGAAGRCDCGVDHDLPYTGQGTAIALALGARDPADAERYLLGVLRVYQAAIHAYSRYRPSASDLTVRSLVTEQGFAPLTATDHRVQLYLDSPANGWEHAELGTLTVVPVPGSHFGMLAPPHLTVTAAEVGAALYLDPRAPVGNSQQVLA